MANKNSEKKRYTEIALGNAKFGKPSMWMYFEDVTHQYFVTADGETVRYSRRMKR